MTDVLLFVSVDDKDLMPKAAKDKVAYEVGEIDGVAVQAAWFQPHSLWALAWTGGLEQPSYWGTNMKEAAIQRYEEWIAQAQDGDDIRLLRIDPGTGGVTDETPAKESGEADQDAVDLAKEIASQVAGKAKGDDDATDDPLEVQDV